jgi:hypothetical protein
MRISAIGAVLALNAALLAALAALWSDESRRTWTEPQALAPTLPETAAPSPEQAEISRYRQTVERPLFAANRRPAPRQDPAAQAQAAVDTLKDVRLLGTYGAGPRGGIIVVNGGQVQRVAVGESIGGWKVIAGGQGRSVELVRGNDERRTLELALNSTAPAVPARPAPPAATGTVPAVGGAAGEPTSAPAAGQLAGEPKAVPGPAAPIHDATSPAAVTRDEQLRRERLARINQRRAASGLPPLGQ